MWFKGLHLKLKVTLSLSKSIYTCECTHTLFTWVGESEDLINGVSELW